MNLYKKVKNLIANSERFLPMAIKAKKKKFIACMVGAGLLVALMFIQGTLIVNNCLAYWPLVLTIGLFCGLCYYTDRYLNNDSLILACMDLEDSVKKSKSSEVIEILEV